VLFVRLRNMRMCQIRRPWVEGRESVDQRCAHPLLVGVEHSLLTHGPGDGVEALSVINLRLMLLIEERCLRTMEITLSPH